MKDTPAVNTKHLLEELSRAKHLLALVGSLAHNVRWGHMNGEGAVKFLTEWYPDLKPYYHAAFDAITVPPPHTAKNVSTSPDTHTRLVSAYQQHCQQRGEPVDPQVVKYYDDIKQHDLNWANTVNTRHDLEWDLRTTEWILQKVRDNSTYAQSLYAALCNNLFKKRHGEDKPWSCSWRHAGAIIAHMQAQGDYMNWYCSGMGEGAEVPEGTVTDEIHCDLDLLGWGVVRDLKFESLKE